ncbi:adenylate/guanylate cyclase domain-containing protein [Polycladidibacter stylochi]|uniref:adenylate/guanylate cyclase domain-containing protein n=1 Tax=Polycladidibacter stylochi TaxID=1807766 RepID=UPI0012E3B6DF|nr:adenylate/guanylate cyclase domain-containing protein [Pseudovibrio stylochi]
MGIKWATNKAGLNALISVKKYFQKFQWSLAVLMSVFFGLLVAISGSSVLLLSSKANIKNIEVLGWATGSLAIEAIRNSMLNHLQPSELVISDLRWQFQNENYTAHDRQEMLTLLMGSMLGASNISRLVFVEDTGLIWGVKQNSNDLAFFSRKAKTHPHDLPLWLRNAPVPSVNGKPTWGALKEVKGGQFANVTVRVETKAGLSGYLTAVISMQKLSEHLKRLQSSLNTTLFALNDEGRVVAYVAAQNSTLPTQELLTPAKSFGDPVLLEYIKTPNSKIIYSPVKKDISASLVSSGSKDFFVISSHVKGFALSKWTIGYYLPASIALSTYDTIKYTSIISLMVVFLTVLLAVLLARKISTPLQEVAKSAGYLADFQPGKVKPMPGSNIKEMNQVANAMNASAQGLWALARYVPRNLLLKLMEAGFEQAITAKEAEVTVMFTDIVDFTSLSEKLPVNELSKLLNDHFELLIQAVEAEGGTLDKYLGDGILAFWNAPNAMENHAQAALRAADNIARKLAEQAEANGSWPIRTRIGIHTGRAIVGNIGTQTLSNYSVIGDTVNVANRLQVLGKELYPDARVAIIASVNAAKAAQNCHSLKVVGKRQLRGRRVPVEVWGKDYKDGGE